MTLPRLKDYRAEKIDMSCSRCGSYGEFERKALIKKFGANTEFAELRRILANGCEHAGTDRCYAAFPCLLNARFLIETRR
ncbi:hypothetical protein D3C80_559080 [compost metagenome]